jgi:hypothetical protein
MEQSSQGACGKRNFQNVMQSELILLPVGEVLPTLSLTKNLLPSEQQCYSSEALEETQPDHNTKVNIYHLLLDAQLELKR